MAFNLTGSYSSYNWYGDKSISFRDQGSNVPNSGEMGGENGGSGNLFCTSTVSPFVGATGASVRGQDRNNAVPVPESTALGLLCAGALSLLLICRR